MSLDARRSAPGTPAPARPRLIEAVREALGRGRGVALLAGPGYGKTVLLEAIAAELEMPSIWIDLGRLDGDPSRLRREVRGQSAVLREAAVRSGARLSRPPRGDRAFEPRAAMVAIDAELADHAVRSGRQALLVLDELEQVDPGGPLAGCVEHLLRRLPASWKVAVAGRHEPWSAELARQIQYGEIEVLGEQSLALTLSELEGELEGLEPPGTGPEDAAGILARTAGWPAGVAHLERARRGGDVTSRTMASYFRRSVVGGLPERLLTFMIETSILPFLEPELCDRVRQAADSASILGRLADRHLVGPQPEAGPGDGYHPLLRSFLEAQLDAELPPVAVRRLRQRAAAHLAGRGLLDEAFEQLIASSDWRGVASLLRRHADALLHSGRAAALLGWVDALPPAVLAGEPWLLVHRARALRQCGVADEPLTSLKRARRLFAVRGDGDGEAAALVEEAKHLEAADHLADARRLCASALELAGDPQVRTEILVRIALDSALLGHLPEAAEAAHQALELMPSRRDACAVATDQVFVIARLGLAEALGGDFRAGRRHLEQACRMAGRDRVGVVSAMLAHYLHGFVCARAGAHEVALSQFDLAQAIAEGIMRDDYVRLCHGARGETLANLGRLDAAESELRESGWLCNRWVDAAYFYFRTGQHQQAAEIYESDIARAAAVEDPLERARAQALLGVCLLAMGPSTLGRRLLEQAARSHAIRGFNSRTPGIRLHLADVAFREGDPELGAGLLRQALAMARAGGAHHFFAFQPEVVRRCLDHARELGIEPEFALECRRRLGPALLDRGPERAPESAPRGLLSACSDERIRADLERSLSSGRLTARGLRRLLDEYGLTWRESQVFVRYYLPGGASGDSSRQRSDLAAQLGIAEHTVRHHVNSIRSKLGLGAQRGMAAYRWALSQDIISA